VVNRDGNRAAMNKHNSKDPRALSGGETSFATICLLLSIWECVACPLRCLDEFDVFMDAHNRKLAMSLLVCCVRSIVFRILIPLFLADGDGEVSDRPAIHLDHPASELSR
jgi:hypothetical protein